MKKIQLELSKLNELWKRDDIISIEREVDVGQHLPQDIIGKGAEFTLLREISNKEFNRLWQICNSVIRNMFIWSSDEVGIEKYIQLIDLEITGTLEEKRKKVFLEWNRQTIWTHRALEKWMDVAVGKDAYEILLFYNDYEIEFVILMDETTLVDFKYLVKNLRDIIPANLGFSWTLQYKNQYYYGHYAVIDREKTVYQKVKTNFEKDHNIYYGMANVLKEKEITYKFPNVCYVKEDGWNVKKVGTPNENILLWGGKIK